MGKPPKTEIYEYGVHVYNSRHKRIRALKRLHTPGFHGFRVWPSSWLLMDFFEHSNFSKGIRIMEVGCGWGLAGIYCAKKYRATVTGVDRDAEVFPYLRLHADLNKVPVTTIEKDFDGLKNHHFKEIDVIIGADICFWNRLVEPLNGLVNRAMDSGVKLVLIADPGRFTFDKFSETLTQNMEGQIWQRTVQQPYPIEGKILKIGSLFC